MEQVVSFLFKYREGIFSKGQFSFAAHPSVLLVAGALLAIGVLAYFLYPRSTSGLTPAVRVALMAIRCMLIFVILFCLMRPVIVIPSVIPQSSFVAIMVDDSASMKITDEDGKTRLDAVKALMSDASPFYKNLADKFKVRIYKFAGRAERAGTVAETTGDGQETNIAYSLDQVQRDMSGVPLAGVVLITDGAENANGDLSTTLANLHARGVPVFAVGAGAALLPMDVEVAQASAPARVLAGSSVEAELRIRASGVTQPIRIDLTEDGRPLSSRDVKLRGGPNAEVVHFNFLPTTPGLHRYKFTVPPIEGEAITDNNSQETLVDVQDSHPRVLYVEGEPRWEYGKLRGAFTGDGEKNIILVSLLRSADGKYYRQGVENADELTTGFPKSEEDIFKYDGIVIGNVEATFFNFDQLKYLEQFVYRRGGGLLLLGGTKALSAGGYGNTPIADLSPVDLAAQVNEAGESQGFKPMPADRERDNPVARLQDQPEASQKAWEIMPAITLPEVITAIKPGATVLMEGRAVQGNRTVPLLVEERYGRGRTFAMLASDTWRWRMNLESKNIQFETFWRNLLRYMVQSDRQQIEARPDRTFYGKGQQAHIRIEVADKKFNNVTDARVTAKMTLPSGKTVDLDLKPETGPGFEGFGGIVTPDEDGLYLVDVTATGGPEGKKETFPAGKTSFLAGPLNQESFNAAQNQELLKRIASETGGGYYPLRSSANLIDDITHKDGNSSVKVPMDLWDMPVNFLLLVGLATCEWFVRKRKGLA